MQPSAQISGDHPLILREAQCIITGFFTWKICTKLMAAGYWMHPERIRDATYNVTTSDDRHPHGK